MACKRKTTSWRKFEYVFRSVVPQERKWNLVLCFCAHRVVAPDLTQKTHQEVWSLGSYSLSLSFPVQILPKMSSLQVLPCDPKGGVEVFCFLGPPGRIHCRTGMLPREMEIPESALDTVHGPFPNPHSRLQLAAKFGTIMQESSLLVRHLDLSWGWASFKEHFMSTVQNYIWHVI